MPSEYVRELIRRDQKRKAREQLDALVLEGLDSGHPTPVDAGYWSNLHMIGATLLDVEMTRNQSAMGKEFSKTDRGVQ